MHPPAGCGGVLRAGKLLAVLAGMFHASRALSASGAAGYYEREYKRGDYYTCSADAGVSQGRWYGLGAGELGLRGDVRQDDFVALLEGRAPTGDQLVEAQLATGRRRAGWDFTCSADKTVSIAALVFQDERLAEAHAAAVGRALRELETFVQTRARGGSEVLTTGRMVAATFRHESSRDLDPQLHTHVVVLNLTRRDDGQWRALYERPLFQVQRFATAVYRAEMARAIERLGYRLEARRDGSVGIGGFEREQIEVFSKRRGAIEQYARSNGKTTRQAGQEAAFGTRRAKRRDIDEHSLRRGWQQTARALGLDPKAWRREHERQSGRSLPFVRRKAHDEAQRLNPRDAAQEAVAYALEHLGERQAAFRVSELERVALGHGLGQVTIDDVRVATATRSDLARAGGVVTTEAALARERHILDLWRYGRGRAATVPTEPLKCCLKGEQLAAAGHILTASDRVIGVEGKAGAGKSYLLAPVVEACQRAGWQVRGMAPTTSAVAVLQEHHVPAVTVARFLRQPRADDEAWRELKVGSGVRVPARQLWIVDEAGLLSSAQMEALLQRAEAVKAKVVLVGDRMQHKPVEAGRPFKQLVDAGMATARLERIRRQRDPGLRAAVQEAARGNAAHALLELDRQGCVVEIKDRDARLRYVAERYMRLSGSRLVTTATNQDRRDVNALIRVARIRAGEVEAEGLRVEILVSKDLTSAQRKNLRSYEVGDHLTFRTRSRVHQVEAGSRGRVLEADYERRRLRVQLHSGQIVTYDPKRLSGVEAARVEEREFAPGDWIEFRRPDTHKNLANGQLAQVVAVDQQLRRARLRVEGTGRFVTVNLDCPQALDLAYASTSHRSQGRTVDHVIDLQDARLGTPEGLYVGTSRGRNTILVATDDRVALLKRLAQATSPDLFAVATIARDVDSPVVRRWPSR